MFSKNNIEIIVGQKVLILEVPIAGQHKFVEGEVIKLTDKQVVLESKMKDRWGGTRLREVKRYADQVIVVNWED